MFVTVVVFEAGNSNKVATGISPSSQYVEGQKLLGAPALLPRFFALTHGGNQWFDIFSGLPFLFFSFLFPIVHRVRKSPELGRNSRRSYTFLEEVVRRLDR